MILLRLLPALLLAAPALLRAAGENPSRQWRTTIEVIALPLSEMQRLVVAPRRGGAEELRQQCRKLAAEKRAIVLATPSATAQDDARAEFSSLLESSFPSASQTSERRQSPRAPAEIQAPFEQARGLASLGIAIAANSRFDAEAKLLETDLKLTISPAGEQPSVQEQPRPARFYRTNLETNLLHAVGSWTLLGSMEVKTPPGAGGAWRGLCFLIVEPADDRAPVARPQETPILESVIEAVVLPQQEAAALLEREGPAAGPALRDAALKLVQDGGARLAETLVLAAPGSGEPVTLQSGEECHSLVRRKPDPPPKEAATPPANPAAAPKPRGLPNEINPEPAAHFRDLKLDLGWKLEIQSRKVDDAIESIVTAKWVRLLEKDAAENAKRFAPPRCEERSFTGRAAVQDGQPSLLGTMTLRSDDGRLPPNADCLLLFLTSTNR